MNSAGDRSESALGATFQSGVIRSAGFQFFSRFLSPGTSCRLAHETAISIFAIVVTRHGGMQCPSGGHALGSAETGCDTAAMRLLVLDDDAAAGRLVGRVARVAGYQPVAITDPAMMPASLSPEPPAVVVLDLQLGQDDGIEQLRWLAEQHFDGTLILISGFNSRVLAAARDLAEDLGLHVAATLCKPLQLRELEDALQRVRAAQHSLTEERVIAAISAQELCLNLQPIVVRSPRKLCRLSARVVWMHPEKGTLPELAFMPIADTSNYLATALTDWLIRSATEAYHTLNGMGTSSAIEVNLPSMSLTDRSLPERISSQLQKGRMPPAALWLEVNASPATLDVPNVAQQLARLCLKDVRMSLAEFGTSASYLSLLRRVPFCDVKIGRNLIRDIGGSSEARVIVEAIIGLAKKMGMEAVASGVETELAARTLESLGIDALQGRLFGEPMSVEQVQPWLTRWRGQLEQLPTEEGGRRVSRARLRPSEKLLESDAESISDFTEAEAAACRSILSGRQLEVVQHLAEGRSVKDIARALGLSIGTVKVHLSRAYAALGARNRVEAVIKAGYMDQSDR